MKKIFATVLTATIVLSLLASGTLSYFTANAENIYNKIVTGEMCLGTDPEPFMNLSGIMPGGEPQEVSVKVFTGTPIKFFYKVKAVRQTGTSTKLWNAVMMEVKDSVTGETWTGPLNALETGWFARQNGVPGGGSANGRDVNFKAWIPQEADVDEETTATIKFEFDAEQWRPVTQSATP